MINTTITLHFTENVNDTEKMEMFFILGSFFLIRKWTKINVQF